VLGIEVWVDFLPRHAEQIESFLTSQKKDRKPLHNLMMKMPPQNLKHMNQHSINHLRKLPWEISYLCSPTNRQQTNVPFEGRIEKDVPSLPLTIFHEKSAAAFRLLLIVTTPRKP
jgi:hypothetical protein